MSNLRAKRAKLNIIVSLGTQIVALICGLIVPKLMIEAFGSEAYGATTSIAQFLSYITLLEGGIGGVARAALYKPLAENNIDGISEVVFEIKRLFRMIAYLFALYVFILACSFKSISNVKFLDWTSSFLLVIVISISTFAQYFVGISYSVLLQAAQKTYITHFVSISATLLNTGLVVVLVNLDFSLVLVKFVSSCVFVLRPIAMWLYVRRHYGKLICKKRNKNLLSQKWTGLGQHLAYFLHSHTDVAVLTLFCNLESVAVYSVYNMVVSQIQTFASSFSTGMEALFGDMLAKKEYKELNKTFSFYESLISIVSVILFASVLVLIIPFVKLYTKGITDVNYIHPLFSVLLTLSALVYCLRIPYHSLTIAAGHFKQTQMAAYGEALINIALSVILVKKFGLNGVAIGTLIATLFRFIFYVFYLSKNILNRSEKYFIKRLMVNTTTVLLSVLFCNFFASNFNVDNYFEWFVFAVISTIVVVLITILLNVLFYRHDMSFVIGKFIKKRI